MRNNLFNQLVSLVERLRGPSGCPWDREQSIESLTQYIIEEAYEVVSTIDSGEYKCLKGELGDLLFQIIFVCRIAEEKGMFNVEDVLSGSISKMTSRHPHVFGSSKADTSEEVLVKWDNLKRKEDGMKSVSGYLSNIPHQMPALLRAYKVSSRASRAGFDWHEIGEVLIKIEEELSEFVEAAEKADNDGMEEEIGDILFTVANAARFMGVNPEDALRKTIEKFLKRFTYMEQELSRRDKDFNSSSFEEMETIWKDAKAQDKYS